MNREKMLSMLHNLQYGMIWPPQSWEEDTGFTERPIKIDGTGWGCMYCDESSSFYKLPRISEEKMKLLKNSIKECTFTYGDIVGTSLEKIEAFEYWDEDEFTAERLDGLLNLPDCMEDFYYCGFGPEKLKFYSTEEAFLNYFAHIDYVDVWDELSDAKLACWIDRLFDKEEPSNEIFLYEIVE